MSKILGTPIGSVDALLGSARSDALEELFDLCESDEDCAATMATYSLDRDSLSDIYSAMLASGAAQWIGYHYVPVSTIAYAKLLRIAAEGYAAAESRSDKQRVALALVQAVEQGRFA